MGYCYATPSLRGGDSEHGELNRGDADPAANGTLKDEERLTRWTW